MHPGCLRLRCIRWKRYACDVGRLQCFDDRHERIEAQIELRPLLATSRIAFDPYDRAEWIASIDAHDRPDFSGGQSYRGAQRIRRQLFDQCFDDFPRERRPFRHDQFSHRVVRKESASIPARANKGIEDIHLANDLGELTDMPTLQLVRISLPIPPLVRLAYYLCQPVVFRARLSDRLITEFGMLLDQRTFITGQPTRLSNQRLWYGKEADVVQEPCKGKPLQLFPVVSQSGTHLRCQNRNIHEICNQRMACRTAHCLNEQLVASLELICNPRRQGGQGLEVELVLPLHGESHACQLLLRTAIPVCGAVFVHGLRLSSQNMRPSII